MPTPTDGEFGETVERLKKIFTPEAMAVLLLAQKSTTAEKVFEAAQRVQGSIEGMQFKEVILVFAFFMDKILSPCIDTASAIVIVEEMKRGLSDASKN